MQRTTALAAALITITLAASVIAADAANQAGDGWIQLFNGKNLTGWTPKIKGYPAGENFGNTFRVEDGVIKVCYDKYEGKFNSRFGHLFFNRAFSNYILRVEYRFVGEQMPDGPGWAFRNSGIMIHGQTPESMDRDQPFPASIEVQLLGGKGTGERPTGNLCTPGTDVVYEGKLYKPHVLNSKSKTYHGDQWVTAEVEVRGNKITHRINGEEVLTYTDPQLDKSDATAKKLLDAGSATILSGGSISLQSESHPCEFRKVEIKEL